MRDSWDAENIQEMQDLCESHTAFFNGIVFGVSYGLGRQLMYT